MRRHSLVLGFVLSTVAACSQRGGAPSQSNLGEAREALTVKALFTPAGFLSSPRYRHTATLLLDGKVLIAGGATQADEPPGIGRVPDASLDLFEVMTGKFERVGDLAQARWGHSATLLRDGRVLLVGGFDAQGKALGSAELFTPDGAKLSRVARLKHPRGLHTATRLADGNVLILGGSDDPISGAGIALAEIFDVSAQRFESLGELESAGFPHAAALMPDGRVASIWSQSDEMRLAVFDPDDKTFSTSFDPLPCEPPAVCGPDGCSQGVPECFDVSAFRNHPADDTLGACTYQWRYTIDSSGVLIDKAISPWPSPPPPPGVTYVDPNADTRLGAAYAIASSDGQLVAVGPSSHGGGQYPPGVATPLLLDEISPGAPLRWPTATALPNGEILVAGGFTDAPQGTSLLRSAAWRGEGLQFLTAAASEGHAATLLPDGRTLFTGGSAGGTDVRSWEDRTAKSSLVSAGSLLSERAQHRALLLGSGSVLVAGGETRPVDASEELFDPKTGKSRALDFRLRARGNAVRISDRYVLFAGSTGLEKVDVDSWSVHPIPAELGCAAPALARLANGHVVVSGDQALFDFEPATEVLTKLRPFQSPGCGAAVVALPGGSILLAGGADAGGKPSAFALRFDPSTGDSLVLPALPRAWQGGSAVPRLDGVLLFGSPLEGSAPRSDIQFDGRFDTFSEIAPIYAYDVPSPSVTLLPDSGLLVAGSALTRKLSGPVGKPLTPMDDQPVLEVKPGQEVDLTATQFSTSWPEDSAGTTASSPSNSPVPVWYPAVGGYPALGTFVEWSDDRATWRVPKTPFPGLGALTYVRSGVTYPLRMVRILELSNGEACETAGACASGQCVDGMCCDRACDGACESCLAKVKGTGVDGICGGTRAGSEDARCSVAKVSTCGQNGSCDGAGSCALYADGTECKPGASCRTGSCEADEPPRITCDGDHTVVGGIKPLDCGRYQCSLATDACLTACATNRDCSEGFACSSRGECEEARPLQSAPVGCTPGCSVVPRTRDRSFAVLGLGALIVATRGRKRRRARYRYRSQR